MTDLPDSFDPQPLPETPVDPSQSPSFFATTKGKVVIGVVAGVVVLALLGALGFFVVSFLGSSSSSGPSTAVAPSGSIGATASASATETAQSETITNPSEKPLESTFTFRNIFAPTLKQPTAVPDTSTASGSSSASSTTDGAAGTLYLRSIETVDGERIANFTWDGTDYDLAEGESIPDTPWQVVEIGDDYVDMLYGDTDVTLAVGEGLTK